MPFDMPRLAISWNCFCPDPVYPEGSHSVARPDELAEAHAWIANDEPLMNAGRPLPSGRVARLVDLFAAIKEEEEQEEVVRQG